LQDKTSATELCEAIQKTYGESSLELINRYLNKIINCILFLYKALSILQNAPVKDDEGNNENEIRTKKRNSSYESEQGGRMDEFTMKNLRVIA
jgi:hypothetical protein